MSETEHKCEDCGTSKNVRHQPCPYAFEMFGDDTLMYLCNNCSEERAQDI